jgi:hypothetical protein
MPAVRQQKTKTFRAKASPRAKVSAKSPTGLNVVGYEDQHGDKWLRVGFRGKWAFARRADLLGERTSFFKKLERQDVAILESALQNLLISKAQNAVFEKKAYVIDSVGTRLHTCGPVMHCPKRSTARE